ncbi:SEC-C metal-binding domain-containing protein [Streptomyces sp. NPDC001978]|uniref:SEC-C metal-binding domain-containing protein n=1 Tax=Streptomyces sp. NPDC001978 TaxID=3364627 RepID=UPI0036B81C79
MTRRHFFTEAEVRAVVGDASAARVPVALADQLAAAEREVRDAFARNLPHALIRQGHGWGLATDAATAPETVAVGAMQGARMFLTAYTSGLLELCPHAWQARPQVMNCDPPVIVCTACLPACTAEIERMTPRWNNECDCCGAQDPRMFPVTMAIMGIYLSGHLCGDCHNRHAAAALREMPDVQLIGRKQPCPCGSGRRYKRCCGGGRS